MRTPHRLALLLVMFSCKQNSDHNAVLESKNIPISPTKDSKHDKNALSDTAKHITFNEVIDSLPEKLKTFIPDEYSAINLSSGDANLDGLTDKILVLRKNSEETTSNYDEDRPDKRIMLLLLGQPDGSYKVTRRNENAICCIDCYGLSGDPFTGTTIKNGYFSIENGIAAGPQHWEQVITFRFDKSKQDWFLYKDHFISYKLNDSNDENVEALVKATEKLKTVKDFGIIPFDKFDVYKYMP